MDRTFASAPRVSRGQMSATAGGITGCAGGVVGDPESAEPTSATVDYSGHGDTLDRAEEPGRMKASRPLAV